MAGKYDKYYITETIPNPLHPETRQKNNNMPVQNTLWINDELQGKLKGAFYLETNLVVRTTKGGPENGGKPHCHDFDEYLVFQGTDPADPFDLGGEIEFWLGGQKFNLTKSFMVYIPAGMKHCPLKHISIDRPIFHFTMGPGTMYTWEGAKEKSPEFKDKSKYFIYGDKPNLKLPEFRHPIPPERALRLFYLDSEVVPGANFYAEALWFWPRKMELKPGEIPKGSPEPHTHSFGEFIGFFGSNPKDIHDLCGEVELWINGEKNVMTNSFLAFVPAGVEHCPLVIRRIDRPIFHFTAGPSKMYTL